MNRPERSSVRRKLWTLLPIGLCAVAFVTLSAQAPAVPNYLFDPGWPKTLPNNWKIGGINAAPWLALCPVPRRSPKRPLRRPERRSTPLQAA